MTPGEAYYARPEIREVVDEIHARLATDLAIFFSYARKLPHDATARAVGFVGGIRLAIRRKVFALCNELAGGNPTPGRAFLEIFVWGTPAWNHYDKLRVQRIKRTRKYRQKQKAYEASPRRKALRRSYEAKYRPAQRAEYAEKAIANEMARRARNKVDPVHKAAEALRKRMAYFGVTDPKDLPPKSPRGRRA